jgi:hypothetical protein
MSHLPLTSGSTTLVGGEKIIADTSILATSKVFVSNAGNSGTIGLLSVRITAGSSFTINSVITDNSTVDYLIIY